MAEPTGKDAASSGPPAERDGSGKSVEALSSFGEALVKAATATSAQTADRHVSAAFALGWQMAQLYQPNTRPRGERQSDDLPGLGSLADHDRVEILVDQVQAGLAKLKDSLEAAAQEPIDLGPLRKSLGETDAGRRKAALDLHRKLLGRLTAADFRLGKAYGLGRALADTCLKPSTHQGAIERLRLERVANLLQWLDDLSTALPPHSGHSVANSLERWRDWANGAQHNDVANTTAALRRQGTLWRALLSGEKAGTEMLEVRNYLDAAGALSDRMRSIVLGVIARFPVVTGLVILLLAGGIALLAVGGSAHLVAGATSLLLAFGLTWKGLGDALGQLAGRVEQPLWEACLDLAIADAITVLAGNAGDQRGRRTLALQRADSA